MQHIPSKYGLKPEDAPLCNCGCGEQVMWNRRTKTWSQFVHRHGFRAPKSEATRKKISENAIKRAGTLQERFDKRRGEVTESGCILWKGNIEKDGYGVMRWCNNTLKAHRVAWELAHGSIPSGSLVCHTCDTPGCVNVEHLFLGTHKANHADRNAKGRQAKGERQGNSKLLADQVRTIRVLHETFDYPTATLAKMFDVTQGNIDHIVARRSWTHI